MVHIRATQIHLCHARPMMQHTPVVFGCQDRFTVFIRILCLPLPRGMLEREFHVRQQIRQ